MKWFRENQKLLNEGEDEQKSTFKEMNELQMQVQKAKEDKKRLVELEKKCKLLEETIKSKNPNSIGMLIQAAKTDVAKDDDTPSKRELQTKIKQLEAELESQDKEFERKLRAMRQEQERIKAGYEARAGNSGDSKLVKELEAELEKTKSYYNKRIREIEDKYKYGANKTGPKSSRSHTSTDSKKQDVSSKQLSDLMDQNSRLLQERNSLQNEIHALKQAARTVPVPPLPIGGAETPRNTDLQSVFYPKDPVESAQKPSPALNPFEMAASPIKLESKPVPELLEMFSKMDLTRTFGSSNKVKLTHVYNVLTT